MTANWYQVPSLFQPKSGEKAEDITEKKLLGIRSFVSFFFPCVFSLSDYVVLVGFSFFSFLGCIIIESVFIGLSSHLPTYYYFSSSFFFFIPLRRLVSILSELSLLADLVFYTLSSFSFFLLFGQYVFLFR